MNEWTQQALDLFNAGDYVAFIAFMRDVLAANITAKMGSRSGISDEFVVFCKTQPAAVYYILEQWDGQPEGYMHTVNGITRWVDYPVAKAA